MTKQKAMKKRDIIAELKKPGAKIFYDGSTNFSRPGFVTHSMRHKLLFDGLLKKAEADGEIWYELAD